MGKRRKRRDGCRWRWHRRSESLESASMPIPREYFLSNTVFTQFACGDSTNHFCLDRWWWGMGWGTPRVCIFTASLNIWHHTKLTVSQNDDGIPGPVKRKPDLCVATFAGKSTCLSRLIITDTLRAHAACIDSRPSDDLLEGIPRGRWLEEDTSGQRLLAIR